MKLIFALFMLTATLSGDYGSTVEAFRKEKDASFKEEGTSPLLTRKERKKFEHLNYFPVDETYKVMAAYVREAQEDTVEFVTSSGSVKLYAKVAELQFTLQGKTLTLPAYQGIELRKNKEYEKYLFVPFTDATSGDQSYGGGRYLDLELPEGDSLKVDFNYAYNPYCAYSDGYSCPIPKRESRLAISVLAGEKVYH
jgi:uncharacterized protein (DUF1684 family)